MMPKLEYLKILENELKGRMKRQDVDEIMRDYAEYFVEGQRQGKTEYEMAYKLGDPKDVARQILSENSSGWGNTQNPKSGSKPFQGESVKKAASSVGNVLWKIFVVCGILLLSPFILMAAVGIIGIIVGILGGLVGLLVGCAAVIVGAFVVLVAGCWLANTLPISAVLLVLLAAIAMIAGGIFGGALVIGMVKIFWQLAKRFCQWLVRVVRRQPKTVPTPGGWAGTAPNTAEAPHASYTAEEQQPNVGSWGDPQAKGVFDTAAPSYRDIDREYIDVEMADTEAASENLEEAPAPFGEDILVGPTEARFPMPHTDWHQQKPELILEGMNSDENSNFETEEGAIEPEAEPEAVESTLEEAPLDNQNEEATTTQKEENGDA